MPAFKDITGQQFGRLTVRSLHSKGNVYGNLKQTFWICYCECGNEVILPRGRLGKNGTKSCGCGRGTHGHTSRKLKSHRTPEYATWSGMKARCLNPRDINYPKYGGRGIKVCNRWLLSFENFLLDMGKRPDGYSIERVNNDGNYEPSNCKWIPCNEQQKNQRYWIRDFAKTYGFSPGKINGRPDNDNRVDAESAKFY